MCVCMCVCVCGCACAQRSLAVPSRLAQRPGLQGHSLSSLSWSAGGGGKGGDELEVGGG